MTAPFWEAAARHELLIQRCRKCGKHQFYPRPFCLVCLDDDIEWVRGAGTGTVYSVTTVRLQLPGQSPPPYQVALITLDEGPRFLARPKEPVRIGDRVRVTWEERGDLPPLPQFELETRNE